jgi:lactate dehydrogenase-like 2-hydroxyacid dehydrogenase
LATIDILMAGKLPERTRTTLAQRFAVHTSSGDAEFRRLVAEVGHRIRGFARGNGFPIDNGLIDDLPRLEIIANFGVGYDGIDFAKVAERRVIVTNTPDVLTEEVADTAIGLLLMTVRELSAAERHLRSGAWAAEGPYRLTATMRARTAGIVGLGRIGLAIARRLEAMLVGVVYHNRTPRADVPYRYYANLHEMARDVDTLVAVLPGSAATTGIIDASVLRALGRNGVLINIGRGNAVDEPALIAALRDRTILAAGLDVFANEPNVPAELIGLDNAVLLPHVGSASVYTRDAMGQLVSDNLTSWFERGEPLTPVPETPWPGEREHHPVVAE